MVSRGILVAGVGAALLAGAVTAVAAPAATIAASLTIKAGPFSIYNPSTATVDATLDGLDQTVSYTVPLTVTDSRSSRAGWNLTITSTAFADGSGHVLADDASAVTTVSSVCVTGQRCRKPRNSIRYPVTVPAGPTAPAAVKFFNAAARTGTGQFTVSPTVALLIPGDTYAGTYTCAVTFALSSGP